MTPPIDGVAERLSDADIVEGRQGPVQEGVLHVEEVIGLKEVWPARDGDRWRVKGPGAVSAAVEHVSDRG